jgi:hypothetical protein
MLDSVFAVQLTAAPATAKPRQAHTAQHHAPRIAARPSDAPYPLGLLLLFVLAFALIIWFWMERSKENAAQRAVAAREQDVRDAAHEAAIEALKHQALQPIAGVAIGLAHDENCYFSGPMTVWTKHSHTVRVGGYGGPSFRVARGVSFRVGGFRSEPITTTGYEEDDQGTLYITSQRIVFDGRSSTKVIKLKDVVKAQPFTDGIQFDIANKNAIIFKGANGLPAAIIFLRVQAGAIGAMPSEAQL